MTNLVMAEEVELEAVGGRSEETMFSAGGRLWAAKSVVKLHPSWAKLIKFLTQGIYGHDWTETETRFVDKKKWKFFVRDGYIWRRNGNMQNLRVLLNRGDQLEVMAALHGGEEATKRKILMTYWWPHLSRMVEQFVKSCDMCQRFQRQKYQERQIFHRHCYL
jgi:hypothetical protein